MSCPAPCSGSRLPLLSVLTVTALPPGPLLPKTHLPPSPTSDRSPARRTTVISPFSTIPDPGPTNASAHACCHSPGPPVARIDGHFSPWHYRPDDFR
ncbi:hypothetical protein B0H17DRAFT_1060063 [Mycena rosella]|uniref:Secreted protein n=1 Tax=Mycena rosella TaxID=1033263 RepID=A0AAD7DKI8_MYCRO|nr:hypothetical protein B0H17DRAFT_1060063 [Mycena rosella]